MTSSTESRYDPTPDPVSRVNIDPFSPPAMKTLVYSPDVRVLVAHGNKQYDISADLVRVTMYRKENSASTCFLTVSNKGGRYSGKITPMDRITVWMKRLTWVQVFSGYIDTGPHHQLYQGVAQIKATCTIKRLMHTYWNPSLTASTKLFDQQGFAAAVAGQGQPQFDSGLGSLLSNLLQRVGGWQAQNIHIQNFPTSFFNFLVASLSANQAANQAALRRFQEMLLGDDVTLGSGRYANSNPAAGAPGPIGAGQAFYVQQIVSACDEVGLGPTTQDVTTGQAIADTAAVGGSGFSFDSNNKKAWEGMGETGLAIRTNAMNSDGAILGVACALGESNLRNLSNPNVPESLDIQPNDGPAIPPNYDSVGLFQQRNFAEWGTLSERMNPRQSARMFFQHLAQVNGWRNMDPGQAIYQVQRGGFPSYYSGFIPQAKQLVQAYREAQQGVSSTIAASPIVQGASIVAGAAGVTVGTTANAVAGAAVDAATDPLGARARQAGKPAPDSEGAVWKALEQIGKPYKWGAKGPDSFDCPGLFQYAFRSIGLEIGMSTHSQHTAGQPVPFSNLSRGDLIFTGNPVGPDAHVVMYLGDGTVIEAPQPGQSVGIRPLSTINPSGIHSIRRMAENGGVDPAAPRGDPMIMGSGRPPGTGGTTTGVGGGTGGTHSEQIARNLFTYIFQPNTFVNEVADMWSSAGGHKDFIDAQPLLQMVQAVAGASLRNFQSAPNGDLIFYYPDYFGLEGKPATLKLEDIELKDVHIDVSDDQLATHVYVAGDITMYGMSDQISNWLNTAGTATVEDEWLFQRLRKVGLGEYLPTSGQDIMRRFGVRPIQRTMSMAGTHELEFMLACQIFMEKWAAQYETKCNFTFMPELFPGMRIKFGDHNLQVYVHEVVHDCDFTNGFTTSAVVSSPTTLANKQLMANTETGNASPEALNYQSTIKPGQSILQEYLP